MTRVLVVAVLAAACAGGETASTAVAAPTVGSTEVVTPPAPTTAASAAASTTAATALDLDTVDTGDVPDFGLAQIGVGDETWLVAVADEPAEQTRGLMQVADLGDLDGMIFVHDSARLLRFTMRNTLIPLDLGLFDETGSLAEVIEMVPCEPDAAQCPSYPSSVEARWAIETEAGRLSSMPLGTELSID